MIDTAHIKYHVKWLLHIIKLCKILDDKRKYNFLNATRIYVS
jgi:hypothetical protein